MNLYATDKIDLTDNPFQPKDCPDIAMHTWGELRSYWGIPEEGPVSDDQARDLIHGYYACISYVDAQLGRLLDELKRLDLEKNTIIILWGDHGWNLGEHGLWAKHCNFENCTHAPLMVSIPGQATAGQSTDELVEFVDVFPSLVDLCGLPMPERLDGTSFVPVIENPKLSWKQAAFSQFHRGPVMGHSMKTDRYRYTEWGERGKDGMELYDHKNDPHENVSIALKPENKKLIQRLSYMLNHSKKDWITK